MQLAIQSHREYVTLIQGEKVSRPSCISVTALSRSNFVLTDASLQGDITIHWAPFRPEAFTLHLKDAEGNYQAPEQREFKIPGHG